MEKGKLLGKGITAEVYEWGQDRVLKLFFGKYNSADWVNNEAKVCRIVHETGVISPEVYDTVEIDGRRGIIYQRINGKPTTEHIQAVPWESYYYIKKAANLQHNIHKFSANGLPSQKERFTYAIRLSSSILGNKTKTVMKYMESLPDGESICHGDFYLNNIIVSGNELVPIDWASTYRGNPLGDVAKTCMIICSPAASFGSTGAAAMLSYFPKSLCYWVYLNKYMRLAKVKFNDIDAWVLPVAVARLEENIPGERKWLLDIIDKRLEQLN